MGSGLSTKRTYNVIILNKKQQRNQLLEGWEVIKLKSPSKFPWKKSICLAILHLQSWLGKGSQSQSQMFK